MLVVGLALLALSPQGDGDKPPPPNVVVVFTDDLGYGDVGCYGEKVIRTPHIDSLARDGVRCTDFYVSQPVCSASRASLLTGCYANRVGIHGALGPGARHGLAAAEVTLAEVCRSKGLATAAFGKWHLGHLPQFLPTQHGFDEYLGIPYSNDMHPEHPETPDAYPPLPLIEGSETVGTDPDQDTFTGTFTDRAVAFMRKAVAGERPFFVYLAHPMPHVPLHAGAEARGKSDRGLFGDVIQELDDSVGTLLAVLDELGVADNTLVIFSSDNGPWLSYGNHAGSTGPLREGKGTTFEGGVRVPFLARWPGHIPRGLVCREPAMTIDVLPTVARLLGADLPPHPIDGRDIWPLLSGAKDAKSPHEALYFWYHDGDLEAMRMGKWKLHFPHGYRTMQGRAPGKDGRPGQYDYSVRTGLELYDLANDVGEKVNVADDVADIVEAMTALADAKRAELGDALQKVRGGDVRAPGRAQ